MHCEKFSSARTESSQKLAERCMATAASIEDLMTTWVLGEAGTVVLGTGFDDNDQHTLMFVELSLHGEQSQYGVSLSEMRARYSYARPISEFTTRVRGPFGPSLKVNDKKFDAYCGWNSQEVYSDIFCQSLVTPLQAMPVILSYATANVGEVRISPCDLDLFEDCEEIDTLRERKFLNVSLNYQLPTASRGIVPGFGEWLYIDATEMLQ